MVSQLLILLNSEFILSVRQLMDGCDMDNVVSSAINKVKSFDETDERSLGNIYKKKQSK